MKLTSSASFSPSIRISLRLKIHQAQAKNFCRVLDIRVPHVMKTHMFCADLLDDPIMQPAESIRVPRLSRARRWEQIRIRRVAFMLFYKKFYCIFWEQHRSDGIWRFRCADDQLSILPRDAFVDREGTVLNIQVLPSQGQQFSTEQARCQFQIHRRENPMLLRCAQIWSDQRFRQDVHFFARVLWNFALLRRIC